MLTEPYMDLSLKGQGEERILTKNKRQLRFGIGFLSQVILCVFLDASDHGHLSQDER